jgi:hypothetical protein
VTASIALIMALALPDFFDFWLRTAQFAPSEVGGSVIPVTRIMQELLRPFALLWQTGVYIQAGIMLLVGASLIVLGFVANAARPSRKEI